MKPPSLDQETNRLHKIQLIFVMSSNMNMRHFLVFDDAISTVFLTSRESLNIPDLTEQRGELVVIHFPGREHLCVVVAERPQLRQAAQETGEVLRFLGMVEDAHLPQQVQHVLLEPLNSRLVLNIRSVWTGR